MSTYALITGTLFKPAEEKTSSKTGRTFVSAVIKAESGAKRLEPLIGSRHAERSAGLALVAGVLHVVVGGVDLLGPGQRVAPAAVLGAEATRVHRPCVEIDAGAPRRGGMERGIDIIRP